MSSWVILAIVIVVFFAFVTSYLNFKFKKKLNEIKSKRNPLTKLQFRQLMLYEGFDKTHIEVIYDTVQEYLFSDGFSIYPEDDLIGLYEMDDMDFMAMLDEISFKLKIKELTQEDFSFFETKNNVFSIENILKLYKRIT